MEGVFRHVFSKGGGLREIDICRNFHFYCILNVATGISDAEVKDM